MEAELVWMRRDRFDFGLAFGIAVFAGAGATGLVLGVLAAIEGQGATFGLSVALVTAVFSAPVWLFGVAFVGLPLAVLLERLGWLSAPTASLLGAATTGGVWFWVTFSAGSPIPLIAGGVAGGVAGLAGWAAGSFAQRTATP